MSAGRAATIIVMLAVPAILWGFLNHAKNDVLATTRSLVRQIDKVEENVRFDDFESRDRAGAAFAMFLNRYRFPEGNPDRQETLFCRLWGALRDCDPETAAYGDDKALKTEDGVSRNHRQVRMKGRRRDGERFALRLEWVQYRGSWYIQHGFMGGEDLSEYSFAR